MTACDHPPPLRLSRSLVADGEGSILTASLSDAPGDESPRLAACSEGTEGTHTGEDVTLLGGVDSPTAGDHSEKIHGAGDDAEGFPASPSAPLEEEAGNAALTLLGDGVDPAPEDAHPEEPPPVAEEGGGPEVTGGERGAEVAAESLCEEYVDGGGDESGTAACDNSGDSGALGEGIEEERSPEEVLLELSLAGTTALEDGNSSSSDTSTAGDAVAVPAGDKATDAADESRRRTERGRVARSLFGATEHKVVGGGEGVGKGPVEDETLVGDTADTAYERPVVPSQEELKLRKRYTNGVA